jgi:hypothetical protein
MLLVLRQRFLRVCAEKYRTNGKHMFLIVLAVRINPNLLVANLLPDCARVRVVDRVAVLVWIVG